ncbi:MAG: redox-regulated ATPase YchF, partial [Candidatus Aenigmatarchaeota archaeon]
LETHRYICVLVFISISMLEVGIVGKPSSGKSSFFKAATLIDVKISPVPFTTIKPNRGTSHVIIDCVCKEFGTQCKPKYGMCKNGKRFIPVLLWDVAGLVPDAHLGKGMGISFLDDIRQTSALVHIVDASGMTDEEGKVTTDHDPEKDLEFLEREIDLWFATVIKKAVTKFERQIGKMDHSDLVQMLSEQLSGLEVKKGHIEETLNKVPLAEVEKFAAELRKIAKPIIIAANKIDLNEAQMNFEKMKQKHSLVIPTSAEAEIALKKAAEKNLIEYLPGGNFSILDQTKLEGPQLEALEIIRKEVIEKYGSTGVQTCLNTAVFELLNHIAVYPVADARKLTDKDGNVLPDVFLVPKGTTVKELAFRIHTSLGEKFIAGIDARTKRRLAADHALNDRDVVEIVHAK